MKCSSILLVIIADLERLDTDELTEEFIKSAKAPAFKFFN